MKLIESIFGFLKPSELDEDLQRFEIELQQTLIPVIPYPQFVTTLRQSLLSKFPDSDLHPAPPQQQILKTGLLVSGGIIGSIFVVLTGIRGLISIIGFIGLILSWYKQYSQESLTPSNLTRG
jgi:hypothetical protein